MRRWLLSCTCLLITTQFVNAADNAVIVTVGSGITMKSKDVGSGVQAMQPIISDTSGNPIGVTGNPLVVTGAAGTFPATQVTSPWVVSNGGTFATQSAITAASGSIASGAMAAGSMVDLLTMRGTKAPGTAAANSALTGCVYTAAGVTLADGQQAACQLTSTGAQLVSGIGIASNASLSNATFSGIGGRAQSAEIAPYTATQFSFAATDLVGRLITTPYANPENWVQGTTAAMTGTTSTSLIAAPAAGLRNYVWVSCVNSHATVGTFVTIQDGSGGTALATLAAGSLYGGQTMPAPIPIRQPTTATALFVANVTTGANVICSATGYKSAL